VPVARWVAQRIKTPGKLLEFEQTPLENGRWPDAAWNIGNGRIKVAAGDQPLSARRPSISLFRDSSWIRLSDRALDGFIKRAVEGSLRMPDGFLDALRSADRKNACAA
jgi:DNA (cytosine-5)-methyltransferase 1